MDLRSRTRRVPVLVVFLLLILASSRATFAMNISMYDRMATGDQKAYFVFLVGTAEQALKETGQNSLAKTIDDLFKSKSGLSAGEVEFRQELDFNRRYLREHPQLAFPIPAETALVQVLSKHHILMPRAAAIRLTAIHREKPFWPTLPLRTL